MMRARRSWIVAVAAAGALVVAAGVTLAVIHPWSPGPGRTSSGPTATPTRSTAAASYPDLLKPTGTVTVGSRRWISPCRVLTDEDAARIFEPPAPTDRVMEAYQEQSVPLGEYGADELYRCDRGAGTKDPTVGLEVRVFDRLDVSSVAGLLALRDGGVEERADALRSVRKLSSRARALVDRMPRSVRAWSRAQKFEGTVADLDGTVLPDVEAETAVGIVGIVGHASFRLDWNPTSTVSVADRLDRLAAAWAIIRSRMSDPRLSQSPAPTLHGSATHAGSTLVLEPCFVLDASTLQGALGLRSNASIDRESVRVDLAAKERATITHDLIAAGNSCSREFQGKDVVRGADGAPQFAGDAERAVGGAGYVSVELDLDFPPSSASADSEWDALTVHPDDGSTPVRLATTGAEAFTYTGGVFDTSIVDFRVGDYIGTLSISGQSEEDIYTEPTEIVPTTAQYVALIDAIAPRIPSAVAAASR